MREEGRGNQENTSKRKHCPLPKFSLWVTCRQGALSEMFPRAASSTPEQSMTLVWMTVWMILPACLPPFFPSSLSPLPLFLSSLIFWKFKSHTSVNLFTSVKYLFILHIFVYFFIIFLCHFVCHMAFLLTSYKYLKDRVDKFFLLISSLFYLLHSPFNKYMQNLAKDSVQDWFSVNSYSLSEGY